MTLSLEWIDDREGGGGAREEAWVDTLETLLRIAGQQEGMARGIVTLTFTDDEGIRDLNRQYRGIDKPTDVLSFSLLEGEEPDIRYDGEYETAVDAGAAGEAGDAGEDGGTSEDDAGSAQTWRDVDSGAEEIDIFADLLGDVIISVPRAEAQAAEYGHSFERELGFLFVHGFLHLLGYDHADEEQEKEMFAIQEAVLQEAGLLR